MSKKLLLVNDRRGIARTVRSIAPELGLDIVVLDDIAQAATRVAEIAPDVVIIDQAIAADEMIDLLRSVLHAAADAQILIAARADDPSARVTEGMARFHARERLSFLRRPFSRKRIIAALQAVLGGAALLAALAYLLATAMAQAAAAEIKYDETRQGIHYLLIRGAIQPADVAIFTNLADTLPPGKVVVALEGPGGALRAGLNIGLAIHRRGYGTAALSECASVCGVVWLAGTPRYFIEGARIGFHAAYVKDDNGDRYETGHGNALVGAYLANLGLSYAAVEYLTSAAPDDMAWLTPAKAGRLGIDFAFIPVQGHPAPAPPMPPAPFPTLRPMPPLGPATAEIFPHLLGPLPGPPPVTQPPATSPASPTSDPPQPPPRAVEMSPAQLAASTTAEYAQGRQDRFAYERWFVSLGNGGAYQQGALFWSGNRSLPHPPTCQEQPNPSWQAGCMAAKTRLAPSDRRRHAEPNYWWGWNSL
jgi:hypothetical protein